MKILIVCDASDTLLAFRGQLIEALLLNNEVHIFMPGTSRPHLKMKLLEMGVHIHENHLKSSSVSVWSDLYYIRDLYKVIRLLKPDVFFTYDFKPVIYGCILARFLRVRRIIPMLTGLGYNFSADGQRRLLGPFTRLLLKFSLRPGKGLRLILQNKDDLRQLLRQGVIRLKHRSYIVNGSGIDLNHYYYTPAGLEPISFLMISRLINVKGASAFFEAAQVMRKNFPEIRFKLIGSFENNIDSIDPDLYEKIRSGETIEYYGNVADVRPFIKNASIVVLPSYYREGVPRSLLEAMAMGRPIIACNTPGCRETISKSATQINGFLIPAKNVPALVSGMEYFRKHSADILRFGLNGRKLARKKFDVNLINVQMLHILQET